MGESDRSTLRSLELKAEGYEVKIVLDEEEVRNNSLLLPLFSSVMAIGKVPVKKAKRFYESLQDGWTYEHKSSDNKFVVKSNYHIL